MTAHVLNNGWRFRRKTPGMSFLDLNRRRRVKILIRFGYLKDGTMVVVENAVFAALGKRKIEIIRSLQTDAGKNDVCEAVEQKPVKQKTSVP